jgi:hypothetical protein
MKRFLLVAVLCVIAYMVLTQEECFTDSCVGCTIDCLEE